MTTKVVKKTKQLALFLMMLIGIMSCEKDIENIGVNLVENGIFDTQKYNSTVTVYNQNILKNRGSQLGQYLLGVYENEDFGQVGASIVTQLAPTIGIDFGLEPSIDSVVLTIPYQATLTSEVNEAPTFELDSIWGNQATQFNLNVYELQTYLNTLDPLNPSDELSYFTDQIYDYNSTALYSGLFKPSAEDTIMFIERPEVIIDFAIPSVKDRDTIRTFVSNVNGNSQLVPAIRLPLNNDFFTDNFLTNQSAMETTDAFVQFFNGIYIEATVAGDPKSSIMSLNLYNTATNITIYYTNTILTDETIYDSLGDLVSETDINGNGNTVDTDLPVRTKQTATFNFDGITTNNYVRDYTGSVAEPILDNPNTLSGDERLYLQGAAGSFAVIDLFAFDDILELRNNGWLINEASLSFYVDQENTVADFSIVPEKLLVYNYDENEQMTDIFTEGLSAFDGNLERDDDDLPYRYTVNITDYISEVLKSENPTEISKLAVKVYNISDIPASGTDTEITNFSWTPKGVVVHGNQSLNLEKRLKLEISYTEIN
ncbi:MAG: hypothetical protein ACI863_000650 [Flavobacteriales bacterium]|jgi:hypothetical protein|tara:strand:- start:1766 stop:3391 length:1626 start_codon:yes stop_codon:yes gene_type:complete